MSNPPRKPSPPASVDPCKYLDDHPEEFCKSLTLTNPRIDTSWDCLTKRLYKFFEKYAQSYGTSTEDVQDLIQETLIQFMMDISTSKFRCLGYKPIGYVGRICLNKWKSWWKKKKKELPNQVPWDMLFSEFNDGSSLEPGMPIKEDEEEDCSRIAAQKAFNELTPGQQKLMWAHYVEDMKLNDFEKMEDKADGFGKLLHHRAKKKFAELFRKYYNDCQSWKN
ncbi:sigma factor [Larkinella rosea]|uniref:Sigma-70 family RNA polymerase sigma factor n=1 Tax=Larkinella rosea TaxID=2025312 RepID=A0A3P1BGF2_9BACT|nr:sigma factor [Larkinella rosea]RRB00118.1 sigma-70 family RNA polymerase sigma factor [Larkinella rosea]